MLNSTQFLAIYDEFLDSGLTIRDFCANRQMNEAKFFYWQNKLKGQLPPKRGFIPVVFNNRQPRSNSVPSRVQEGPATFSYPSVADSTITCEISYPNGVCVKMNGLPGPQALRALLLLTDH